ncbi:hypothetical protein EZS27_035760 [termite gut metagenome]|uniref:Uncharacterized protein n=1 Tax=termite gut metagenome TaxID=433724 RepID=A0A5J4PWM7_9ZZZZ
MAVMVYSKGLKIGIFLLFQLLYALDIGNDKKTGRRNNTLFQERGRNIASQTKVSFVFYRGIYLCMADDKDSF